MPAMPLKRPRPGLPSTRHTPRFVRVDDTTIPRAKCEPADFTELSPRTFCIFLREFPSFSRYTGVPTGSDSDSGHGSIHLTRATCGPRFSRLRLQTHGP